MNNVIKTAVCSAALVLGTVANASIPAYQVYDLKFTARTTEAKGVTERAGCEDCDGTETYVYRDKKNVVIKGVLAGCGCGAILANGTCKSAILYMWDDTRKLVIKDVTTETGWRVQVIGKNEKTVEHFMRFKATYGDNNEYSLDVTLCGFGTNKKDSKDPDYNYVPKITGYFAGLITAPWYYKAGKCTACSVEPDTYEQSVALPMCGCSDSEGSVTSEVTPFGGTYTVSYNGTKSSKASKNGVSQKTFGLPDYVGEEDYVATNIGD